MWQRLARMIQWVGRHELQLLLGMLVLVVGTWAFIELAGEVMEGDTKAFDVKIVRAMRQPGDPHLPVGPLWLHEVIRDFTALGGYAILSLVLVAVTGYLLLDRKYGTMLLVLVAMVGGYALSMGLKSYFERPRPEEVSYLSHVHSSSFPSGHAMMSAVVYLTLGTLLSRTSRSLVIRFYFVAIAVLVTGLVGVSRVFLGVHYPTDVLAGWAAGLVWATLCWLVARRLQKRGAIERPE